MVGSAVVTMLMSRIDMNIPTISTTSGSCQRSPTPSPSATSPAGRGLAPVGAVSAGSVTTGRATTPPCHKKRFVLYLFSVTLINDRCLADGARAGRVTGLSHDHYCAISTLRALICTRRFYSKHLVL